jgi:hypothetical protein
MSKAVLNVFLEAVHKQMSTENLSHLAAALNVSVPAVCTILFRLFAAIRKHAAPLLLRTRTFIPLRQLLTISTPLKVTESLFSCQLLHCITFIFQKDPQLSLDMPLLQSTYYLENAHSKSSDSWLTMLQDAKLMRYVPARQTSGPPGTVRRSQQSQTHPTRLQR